jgi:tetratricopeptide (TPR) repeat protein
VGGIFFARRSPYNFRGRECGGAAMRVVFLSMGLAVVLCGVAFAVSEQDRETCDKPQDHPDVSIMACTAIIDTRDDGYVLNIAYFNRGLAFKEKGNFDQAVADFDEAIELSPEHADAYFNRGLVLSKKGEQDRAIADFDKVIEISPNDADAFVKRGSAYRSRGDLDRALSDFDQALRIEPNMKAAAAAKEAAITEWSRGGATR